MNAVEFAVMAAREIEACLGQVDPESTEALVNKIIGAPRIFVAGAGRAGLMMRAFAMRLMHLGLHAFVVGEIATPAVEPGDLVIMGSGSGEVDSLIIMAGKAKSFGAELAVITIFPESHVGAQADLVVQIKARTDKVKSEFKSIQPGGNLYEQSLLILLDSIVVRIAEVQGIDITRFKRHANLE